MGTKKKQAEAEPAQDIGTAVPMSEVETPATTPSGAVESCANCGQPATMRETNPGAVPDVYCDYCGQKAYPVNVGQLVPING